MIVRTLEHAPFEGPGSIAAWVTRGGGRLERTRLYAGDALPDPRAFDLLVVLGGPMSVHDVVAHPWLAAELTFLREAMHRGTPVLGVCLGAQLVARALGARVYPAAGREIGWHTVHGMADAEGALFPGSRPLFHWHGETFDLPPGAVRLASSVGCANQAFTVGRRVLGVQCHPEMTPEGARALVAACPGDLAPGPWVQNETAILGADPAWYARANRLADTLLDWLVEVKDGDPGAEA